MQPPNQITARISALNDMLEKYTKSHAPFYRPDHAIETLTLNELIKHTPAPDSEICARLRAHAINIQTHSPACAAFMDALASEYQPTFTQT